MRQFARLQLFSLHVHCSLAACFLSGEWLAVKSVTLYSAARHSTVQKKERNKIYMYMYMYIHVHTCMYKNIMYVHIRTCTYMNLHITMCVAIHTCRFLYNSLNCIECTHNSVCVHVRIYVHVVPIQFVTSNSVHVHVCCIYCIHNYVQISRCKIFFRINNFKHLVKHFMETIIIFEDPLLLATHFLTQTYS